MQSRNAAALYLLDSRPDSPYTLIPYSAPGVSKYLEVLDWSLPWGAGSRFSHLMFYLWYNARVLNYNEDKADASIKSCLLWISKIQSKDDGCWYTGDNVSLVQKINGAMKVLTGFHAANIYDIPYAKQLIDTALIGVNDIEACSNFNIVYVLYAACKVEPEYRKAEVADFFKIIIPVR